MNPAPPPACRPRIRPRLRPQRPQRSTALSLFSGAGGDTLGLTRAGWTVTAFSEVNRAAIETHLAHFPGSTLLTDRGSANIRELSNAVFQPYADRTDLVFAGFPCQGFSHAGKKQETDPRNELVYEFVRVVQQVRPTWFIGENVSGLLAREAVDPKTDRRMPVIQIIQALFADIGYAITWGVVYAPDYGVPQERKRLIILGHRNLGSLPVYPHYNWTVLPPPSGTPPVLRPLLEDTLEGALVFPTAQIPANLDPTIWIDTAHTVPTGTVHPNLRRLVQGIRNKSTKEIQAEKRAANPLVDPPGPVTPTERKQTVVVPGGLISFNKRSTGYHGQICHPDAPSKTIICTYGTCPRLFVGLRNAAAQQYFIRPFTLTELAQIQGFPRDYPFRGTDKEIITQIGNAVPPAIIAHLAARLSTVEFKPVPQNSPVAGGQLLPPADSETDEE